MLNTASVFVVNISKQLFFKKTRLYLPDFIIISLLLHNGTFLIVKRVTKIGAFPFVERLPTRFVSDHIHFSQSWRFERAVAAHGGSIQEKRPGVDCRAWTTEPSTGSNKNLP